MMEDRSHRFPNQRSTPRVSGDIYMGKLRWREEMGPGNGRGGVHTVQSLEPRAVQPGWATWRTLIPRPIGRCRWQESTRSGSGKPVALCKATCIVASHRLLVWKKPPGPGHLQSQHGKEPNSGAKPVPAPGNAAEAPCSEHLRHDFPKAEAPVRLPRRSHAPNRAKATHQCEHLHFPNRQCGLRRHLWPLPKQAKTTGHHTHAGQKMGPI